MSARTAILGMVVGSALFAGCGGGEEAASEEASTSPQEALVQIDEVRKGIDQAFQTYAGGDAKAADEQVGTAYLEHFELVEGPLGEADGELNEKLEDAIREELREKIKAEAPQTEVKALVAEIKADLTKAETALR